MSIITEGSVAHCHSKITSLVSHICFSAVSPRCYLKDRLDNDTFEYSIDFSSGKLDLHDNSEQVVHSLAPQDLFRWWESDLLENSEKTKTTIKKKKSPLLLFGS